ncbi:radical SAM protein, partial [Patescibacteria group bacterium]|nr:radical SAM protein [Patescibacteria group bacterium]
SIPNISPKEIIDYFSSLEGLKLGRFVNENETIVKISLFPPETKLNFIWLELTRKCNLRCLHCYSNSDSSSNQIKKEELLTLSQWKKVIQDASDIGCRRLQFIGGEPMLFGKDIFDLIKLTRDLGYELIEVFTNATLLTERDIKLLSKYDVQVAASIYSKNPEVHDKITTKKGSLKKTIKNIRKLYDYGVKLRLATVIMKQNEEYIEETLGFLKEFVVLNPRRAFDIVRPTGRGLKKEILTDKLNLWRLKRKPIFPKITEQEFIRNKKGHSCWQGKLCVTSSGLVIPCIMAREEICGSVKDQSLSGIIHSDNLQNSWNLSKDRIEICRDCEFRYACFDCRPLAKGEIGNLYVQGNNCLYNPYQGEWKDYERKEVRVC